MINTILRMLGFYDSYGVKYSMSHLKSMKRHIPMWKRASQAEYVDRKTKKICRDSFHTKTISGKEWKMCADAEKSIMAANENNWFIDSAPNTTAVGNLAYVSIYFNSSLVRQKADLMLENYRNYMAINR
jgi:hypothetical protein